MAFLSIIYRFLTNFAFMAMVYFSLNFMEKYPNRAIAARADFPPRASPPST